MPVPRTRGNGIGISVSSKPEAAPARPQRSGCTSIPWGSPGSSSCSSLSPTPEHRGRRDVGGRALGSNPWSQVSRPTKLLVLGSQDAGGAKAGAPNWDALAQPRQGQQFCSRSNSRLFQRSSGDTQTQLQPGTSRGRALELASAPEVTTGEVSKAQQAAPPTPLGIPEGLIASLVYLGKNSP